MRVKHLYVYKGQNDHTYSRCIVKQALYNILLVKTESDNFMNTTCFI